MHFSWVENSWVTTFIPLDPADVLHNLLVFNTCNMNFSILDDSLVFVCLFAFIFCFWSVKFHEAVVRCLSLFINFAWHSVKFFWSIDLGLSSAQHIFTITWIIAYVWFLVGSLGLLLAHSVYIYWVLTISWVRLYLLGRLMAPYVSPLPCFYWPAFLEFLPLQDGITIRVFHSH